MIPEEKQAAVKRALKEAFGVEEFEEIRKLTAGMSSALVFCVVVKGQPYLLRVITRTDALSDPTNQYACMKSGAEKGLAPRVWYASVVDRVTITDFVEARPYTSREARAQLPALLRALHSLPPFPRAKLGSFFEGVEGFAGRLTKSLTESLSKELAEMYARVAAVYPRNDEAEWVSCHNDLKPENVLFDGKQFWLVDWEAAFWNDRNLDLAVVGNYAMNDEAEEPAYLQEYFGEAAGEYRLARFCLMRQILHVFYAMIFLSLAGAAGKTAEANAEAPKFLEFHRKMLAGEVSLANAEAKREYGLVHLKKARENAGTRKLEEALKIVATTAKAT